MASFPIEFLIVGGGVGGLACAVALRRVGHHVLVIEKDTSIDSVSILSLRIRKLGLPPFPTHNIHERAEYFGGTRMPPNMTKIFYHWGMEDKIKNIGAISEGVLMSRSESSSSAGTFVPVLTDYISQLRQDTHLAHIAGILRCWRRPVANLSPSRYAHASTICVSFIDIVSGAVSFPLTAVTCVHSIDSCGRCYSRRQ